MIVSNSEHFTLTRNLYSWDAIDTIFAYKEDLITFDEICMDIFMEGGAYIKISESTGGWYQFIEEMNNLLSTPNEWYNLVAIPAFATNLTLVYDKAKRTKETCVAAYYS